MKENNVFTTVAEGTILSVHRSPTHSMVKHIESKINVLKGLGVEGDAHMGKTVKHEYDAKKDPSRINLRQVHLIHNELLEELEGKEIKVLAGQMGENICTKGIDLLNLPQGTILKIGQSAQIQITGLRSPCNQLNAIQPGLMKAVLDKDKAGNLILKAGVMSIVLASGEIKAGDRIELVLPEPPFIKLDKV